MLSRCLWKTHGSPSPGLLSPNKTQSAPSCPAVLLPQPPWTPAPTMWQTPTFPHIHSAGETNSSSDLSSTLRMSMRPGSWGSGCRHPFPLSQEGGSACVSPVHGSWVRRGPWPPARPRTPHWALGHQGEFRRRLLVTSVASGGSHEPLLILRQSPGSGQHSSTQTRWETAGFVVSRE